MQSTVILVRHGATEANANRLLVGAVNTSLTSTGIAQAKEAAGRVSSIVKTEARLYSSPLIRAYMTAVYIGNACGLPIETRLDLRERTYGPLELAPRDQVVAYRKQLNLQIHEPTLTWPDDTGPESQQQLMARAGGFLESLPDGLPTTVIVSHAGWIHAACDVVLFNRERVFGIRLKAASYIRLLRHASGEWEVSELWNNNIT